MFPKFPLPVYFSALKVALVVGTILLLINQYDAIFSSAQLRWLPAILTYCVPFAVFLLGQRSAARESNK
ncbi:MAG: nitrate/nitrite transporter NrtS [Oleispira sp.]|nr:nitrate/nitrite transporter NrtS [Oleispira sp.]